MGVHSASKELFSDDRSESLCVDASACKGVLLRIGIGTAKRLITKQLWVQGAIPSHSVEGQIPTPLDVTTSRSCATCLQCGLGTANGNRYDIWIE